jgi:uncharacterized protein DUF5335
MSVTTKIPRERWADYFAAFTRKFLLDESPEAVDVEVVEPDWGEQVLAQGAHLRGITYEAKTGRLEFELDSADHRIQDPEEIWVVEEPDGFISAVEVIYPDGGREVVSIKRLGARHAH